MELLRDTLEAGMTTGVAETEDYYIKDWYINDPLIMDVRDFPFALIKPDDTSRADLYIQEDAAVDDYVIHFFPTPIARVPRDVRGQIEPSKQMEEMIDRAIELLREDPTLGHTRNNVNDPIARRLYDVQIVGSSYKQPGFVGEGVFHSAELRIQAKRRAPWRM